MPETDNLLSLLLIFRLNHLNLLMLETWCMISFILLDCNGLLLFSGLALVGFRVGEERGEGEGLYFCRALLGGHSI